MHVVANCSKKMEDLQDALVHMYFSQFQRVRLSDDDAYYQGDIASDVLGGQVTLRLQYMPTLPEVCPLLFVWNPIAIPLNPEVFPGETINSKGCCHNFHTNSNGPGGRVSICHISASMWDPSMVYVQVLLKGAMWLNAYEGHLQTGQPISEYFCP